METKLDISGYLITTARLDEELRQQGYRLLADWQLEMVTVAGYISRYHHHMTEAPTYTEAWDEVPQRWQRELVTA